MAAACRERASIQRDHRHKRRHHETPFPHHPYTNFRPETPSSIVSKDQSDLKVIDNGNQQVLQEKVVEDVLRNKKSVTVTELSNASRRAQQILLNICRAEEKLGIKEIVISEGWLVYGGHEKGLQTPGPWRSVRRCLQRPCLQRRLRFDCPPRPAERLWIRLAHVAEKVDDHSAMNMKAPSMSELWIPH